MLYSDKAYDKCVIVNVIALMVLMVLGREDFRSRSLQSPCLGTVSSNILLRIAKKTYAGDMYFIIPIVRQIIAKCI